MKWISLVVDLFTSLSTVQISPISMTVLTCDPSAISSHKYMMTVTNNVEWDVWLYDDRCLGRHCSVQRYANERDQVSWIQGQRGR